ncbi:MAG: hypothetical protein PVG14_13520 [Anaerolineales bacterium]|jgi:hypothetical protein
MNEREQTDSRRIDTGGGAYIEGQVHTRGGDFIGRDKIITGDITASVAAIGDGIQIIYQNIERSLTDVEIAEQSEAREQRALAESVTAYIKRLARQAELAQKDPHQGNPYKALLEYDLQDAALFYGRSKEIQELLVCLQRDQLTVLHAESGAGKTSLLKAGIIPRLLTDSHLPLYLRPHQTSVHLVLKRGLLIQLDTTPNLANASLHDFLRKVTDLLGKQRLVVIIDQFEELFTMQDEATRTEFIDELATCLEDDSLPVHWILSVRGEWLSQFGTFRPRIRNPFANEYLLRILSRQQAKEVILEPARGQEVTYDSALVDRLLDDLGEREINPPQLQLVCSALFDGINGNQQITLEMYLAAGKASGILKGHLDRFLTKEIPRGQRAGARRLLEALVTSDNHRALRSRTSLIEEMKTEGINEPILDNILTQFIDSRLLRVVELVEKEELAYELAHDYLLSEVALDPAIQARKAAQELLAQKLPYYRRDGLLLSADELAIITPQRKWLALSEEAEELLRKSRMAIIYQRALPWRDFLGGAIGFSLAYLLTYSCQWNNKGLLLFSTFLRVFPAAIAGLALTLSIDLVITSSPRQKRWRRWLVGSIVGAVGFAMTLFFHKLLDVDIALLNLAQASIEGAFWGLVAGLGMVWVITSRRPAWQSLPVVAFASGLTLMTVERFSQAFHGPQYPGSCPSDPTFSLLVGLAGTVLPLSIIGFALLWRGKGWRGE